MVETNHEWIMRRTGIHSRHIAKNELTSDMALKCAGKLLSQYVKNGQPAQIDAIIVATTTPDKTFPSTATIVQESLEKNGHKVGFGFDVSAACAGFIYGIAVANSMIQSQMIKTAMVIGAESMSKIVNWQDRGTCILFGDGAGAVLLEATQSQTEMEEPGTISAVEISSNGNTGHLYTDGGPASTQTAGHIVMNGKEVFRNAVEKMSASVRSVMKNAQLQEEDISHIILHQANARILEKVSEVTGISLQKFINTIHSHGNTSAASIPLALDASIANGTIKQGGNIIFSALGAGITWGGFALKW